MTKTRNLILLSGAVGILLSSGTSALAAPPEATPPQPARHKRIKPTTKEKAVLQILSVPPRVVMPGRSVSVRFLDRTMGKIFAVPGTWDPNYLPPTGPFYSVARGQVVLRNDICYSFEPNMLICEHPEVLLEFPPGTLTYINCSKLEVNDKLLATIGKLDKLKYLSLEETDVTDSQLKFLANMPGLVNLNLATDMVKGPGLKEIVRSKDLQRLDLSVDMVNRNVGMYLEHFPKLTTLFLCHCGIKDSDLPSLAKIKTIEHLKITSNNDISAAGVKYLRDLPKLRILEIADCKVKALDLLQLKGLPLQSIWLNPTNRQTAQQLEKALPGVSLKYWEQRTDIPVEIFDPLH